MGYAFVDWEKTRMADGKTVNEVRAVAFPLRYEPASDFVKAPKAEFLDPLSQGRPAGHDRAAFDYLTGRGRAPSSLEQVQYRPGPGGKPIPIVDNGPVERVVVNAIQSGPQAEQEGRTWTQNIYSVLEGLDPDLHVKVVPANVVHSDGRPERVFVLEMTGRRQGSTDLDGREIRERPTDIIVFSNGRHYESGAYYDATGDIVVKDK
jgi:hypothetical protein